MALRSWLRAPQFDDPVRSRRAAGLHGILAISSATLVACISLTIAQIVVEPVYALLALVAVSAAYALNRVGYVASGVTVLWTFSFLATIVGVSLTGGLRSPHIIWFCPLLLQTAILFPNRSSLALGGLIAAAVGAIGVADALGRLPLSIVAEGDALILVAVLGIATTAAFGWVGLRVLLEAVSEAERSRASVAARDADLRRETRERDRTEDRYRALVQQAPLGIAHLDASLRLVETNSSLLEIVGIPSLDPIAETDTPTAHIWGQPEVVEAMKACVETGRAAVIELERPGADGHTLYLRSHMAPIRTASGEIEGMLALVENITDRRELESRMRQAQKMEAIGTLAGGIAHDFNNYLTVIQGAADVLAADLPPEASMQTRLQDILQAAERSAALTRQLLAIGRSQVVSPRLLGLGEVVTGLEPMLRRSLGDRIRLVFARGPEAWIRADAGQIEQIVLNLAMNARDAMEDGGRIELETGCVETGEPAEPRAVLRISDEGTGIPKEVRERIFEPFFTTKGEGRGTGLGLSTVYGLVEQMGGEIEIASEPGVGSTFRVLWPVEPAPLRETTEAEHSRTLPSPPGGNETILVADENPAVREFVRSRLASAGYSVLEAADAPAARAMADSHAGGIDLLLTEAAIPGGSGSSLAATLAQALPGLRVLLLSDCAGDDPGPKSATVLSNPFSSASLLERVREALDAS